MASNRQQSVMFFQVLYRTPKGLEKPDMPWTEVLEAWAQRSLGDQEIDTVIYHPELSLARPVLGIHKPTSGAFRSMIDLATEDIQDVLSKTDPNGRLVADSTVVSFIPGFNVFALSKGNQSSPGPRSVHEFLTVVQRPEDGCSWVVEPLWDPDKLEALEGGERRVKKFSTVYTTSEDLLNVGVDQNASGFGRAMDELARSVGAELRVKLEVSIASATGKEREAGELGLWRAIAESRDSILGHADKADALVAGGAGGDELLNFVKQRLTVQTEIPDLGDNAKTFTALQGAVVDVVVKQHTRVINLLPEGAT